MARSDARAYRVLLPGAAVALGLVQPWYALAGSGQAGRTTYGQEVAFGNGSARTYLVENPAGQPVALGVELTEQALSDLPHKETSVRLPLPRGAANMQYTFATLDWNPHGHEPPKIYDKPHFDVHFYMVPPSQVERIAGGPDPVVLPTAYVPPDHISPGNQAVPAMGVHWVDGKAPEFNGQSFSNTFIYGASAGELTFVEPMTTLDFLRSKGDYSAQVKQPKSVQKAGWYPTAYRVRYLPDSKAYRIELSRLQKREPSR